jgi:hypothetical protein
VSYSVRWNRRALDALAEIWLANPAERNEINHAAESIDRLLRVNPTAQGESRDDDQRVLFMPPLVIDFIVDDKNEVVRVVKIRHIRRRGRD